MQSKSEVTLQSKPTENKNTPFWRGEYTRDCFASEADYNEYRDLIASEKEGQ